LTIIYIGYTVPYMNGLSTREAAKKLGISPIALKVPAPAMITLGRSKVHVWTEAEIEHVRQLLPKIANGRKTRHKKKEAVAGTKQSKTKKK
jgi:hypothetical protein